MGLDEVTQSYCRVRRRKSKMKIKPWETAIFKGVSYIHILLFLLLPCLLFQLGFRTNCCSVMAVYITNGSPSFQLILSTCHTSSVPFSLFAPIVWFLSSFFLSFHFFVPLFFTLLFYFLAIYLCLPPHLFHFLFSFSFTCLSPLISLTTLIGFFVLFYLFFISLMCAKHCNS